MITIDDKRYKTTETLGYLNGMAAKIVLCEGKERVAIKEGGRWRWYTTQERIAPLKQHYIGHNPWLD